MEGGSDCSFTILLTFLYSMKKMTFFTKFLIKCSGAKIEIINNTPTEWPKYAGIGATILFTGLFAWIACSYALYRVFIFDEINSISQNSLSIAIFLGFIWGLMIFNLDRFIVLSLHKSNKPIKQFGIIIPRVLIALIISVVIALPLELKIFENKINGFILSEKRNKFEQKVEYSKTKFNNTKDKYNSINDSIIKITLNNNQIPTNITNLETDLVNCNNSFALYRESRDVEIQLHNQKITELEHEKTKNNLSTDSIQKIQIYEINKEIQKYKNKISIINSEINNRKDECDRIDQKINLLKENESLTKQNQLKLLEKEKISQDTNLKIAKIEFRNDSLDVNRILSKEMNGDFINQVEYFGKLLNTSKSEKNYIIWLSSIAISLLFLILDLAPIIAKLLSGTSSYENAYENYTKNEKDLVTYQMGKEYEFNKNSTDTYYSELENHIKDISSIHKDLNQKTKEFSDKLSKEFNEESNTIRNLKKDKLINDFRESDSFNFKDIYTSFIMLLGEYKKTLDKKEPNTPNFIK